MIDDHSSEGMFPAWLLWVIAPVTVLAAALIVLALVLGIQAGQRQVEAQRRQEVGIAIQRAMDYRTEGRLEEALAEYQRVLVLDPGNTAAVTGIENLLQLAAASGMQVGPTPGTPAAPDAQAGMPPPDLSSAASETASTPVESTVETLSAEDALWEEASAAYAAGEWQSAEDALLELQKVAPDFRSSEVKDTLYDIYVNLAAETDQAGDLERALSYVDRALALHPDETELRNARALAAIYLDALTYAGVDWERTIELLEELYVRSPNYRDVRERLRESLLAYGDSLADEEQWCGAAEQYRSAVAIQSSPESIDRRNTLEERCELLDGAVALATPTPGRTPRALALEQAEEASLSAAGDTDAGSNGTGQDAQTSEPTETPEPALAPTPAPPSTASLAGRIMYSATDPITGNTNVYIKELGSNTPATLLVETAQQAVFRPDEQRVVYRNLRGDMRGLTALDPATGLELRFTEFAEDARPSWNGEGNRIAFASNREGDRLWRVYTLWADVGSEAALAAYGDSPAWSRAEDTIAYRGCDESGNRCGIWAMNGSGGDKRPLTSVPADDRPDWAPNGAFLAFMSNGRDGNPEIYRTGAGGGEVTRLTSSGAIDGLPVVSPDGNWVAFVSNRSGSWAVYAVPSGGGEAQALFTISGSLDAWQEHGMQWLP